MRVYKKTIRDGWLHRDIKCLDACNCTDHDCKNDTVEETFSTSRGKWDTITYCKDCGWIVKQIRRTPSKEDN